MRKRAELRIKNLNEMLNKNNIKNKESFANYCDEDWINFFSKDQQSANDDKSFNFMQMKFIPPQKLLYREKVWLTNEYSLNSLKQNIPHENNINNDSDEDEEEEEDDKIKNEEINKYFPYKPYPQQIKLMSFLTKALLSTKDIENTEKNFPKIILIESPTGTGKTMMVLSSLLEYLTQRKNA